MNLLVVSLDPKGVSTYRLLKKILKDYYCIACPTTDKPVRIFFPYSYVARKSYKKFLNYFSEIFHFILKQNVFFIY